MAQHWTSQLMLDITAQCQHCIQPGVTGAAGDREAAEELGTMREGQSVSRDQIPLLFQIHLH